MNILVTGAAGYIGSVVAEELIKEGHSVIALDNLQQGRCQAIYSEATFVQIDLADKEGLKKVVNNYSIEAVMHLAAETSVGFSMSDPQRYFTSNVVYGLNLLEAMLEYGVRKMVFSSSAAVYGEPDQIPITEEAPEKPANAYGESKLLFEKILAWYGKAYNLKHISLRYFNAAGATMRLGEDHRPETHLIPNVLKVALGQLPCVEVFGIDYPTPDRSCIRDYIHVVDIAQAHVLALNSLNGHCARIYNLGNGEGFSVLEVVQAAREVTGAEIPVWITGRRVGDPAILVASSKRISTELGWKPKYPDLKEIIATAWEWHKRHPNGYEV